MKKNLLIIIIVTCYIFTSNNLFSQENQIYPKEKPTLKKEIKKKKVSINIIKPLKKPIKKLEITKDEKKDKKVVQKQELNLGIIVPKNKPKIIKKTIEKVAKKSKYFSKKEFDLANKSIKAFEKGNWKTAIDLAKKSRNNDIYNFVQWRHLLTNRNNATYYEYQQFIKRNI